jgi:hypothetical protein
MAVVVMVVDTIFPAGDMAVAILPAEDMDTTVITDTMIMVGDMVDGVPMALALPLAFLEQQS